MRIANGGTAGHIDPSGLARRGGAEGEEPHAPSRRPEHGGPRGAGGQGDGTAGADSQAVALRQGFDEVLTSIGIQLASNAMGDFDEAMADTEENS